MEVLEIYDMSAEIKGKEIQMITGNKYKVETQSLVIKEAILTNINLDYLAFEVEGVKNKITIKVEDIEYID